MSKPKQAAVPLPDAEQRVIPILSRLRPAPGAIKVAKRLGRGIGSGLGKTSGKGQKGQKARHRGDFGHVGFEGGQTPLHRRLPKIGFRNPFSRDIAIVNLRDLKRFANGSVVDVSALQTAGLVPKLHDGVKVLAIGELDRALTVKAHAFSAQAKAKIEAAGGTVETLHERTNEHR